MMSGYFAPAAQHDPASDPNHALWDQDVEPPEDNDENGDEQHRVRLTVEIGASVYQERGPGHLLRLAQYIGMPDILQAARRPGLRARKVYSPQRRDFKFARLVQVLSLPSPHT